jgi:uncharacterized protein YndB with AHSA1/START domain
MPRLELARVLEAERPVVWEAITDADALAQWWGPAGFTVPALTFDPEVGASYRIEMQPPEGDAFFLRGQFRALQPPERLDFTFAWEDPDPDDVEYDVELRLADLGATTRVTMTQGPFRTEARHDLHRDGWTESFDKLEAWLQRRMSAT